MKYSIFILSGILIFSSCKQKNAETLNDNNKGDTSTVIIKMDTHTIPDPVQEQDQIKQTVPEKTTTEIAEKYMKTAVIFKKADSYVMRETLSGGETINYYAENLAEEFKKEGMRVKFNYTLLEIPSNVRMIGKPIKITKMVKA